MKFSQIIAKDEANSQHKSAIARQVYGLEMALEVAWYWFGDVGPKDRPSKLYNETDDFLEVAQ